MQKNVIFAAQNIHIFCRRAVYCGWFSGNPNSENKDFFLRKFLPFSPSYRWRNERIVCC